MNSSLMTWLGQVTTAHGVMVLAPTILAVLGGTMTWGTAAPLLLAGVIGLLWPETTHLESGPPAAASNLEEAMASYGANNTSAAAKAHRK